MYTLWRYLKLGRQIDPTKPSQPRLAWRRDLPDSLMGMPSCSMLPRLAAASLGAAAPPSGPVTPLTLWEGSVPRA